MADEPDKDDVSDEIVAADLPSDPVFEDLDAGTESEPASDVEAGPETALVPQDPLQRYLMEIRRYPLLPPEEEHRIAVEYKEYGDLEAAYRLVTSNLRLVVMIARRYEREFRNLLDLIQEGNIGLMEAVKKFDPYRGIRFPSYAVWWIRAYIVRYIMNNFRLVKVGTTQAQRRLFFNLHKEKQRLEAEGFDLSPKLIAQRLDVKPSEVVEMEQRMGARELSVDAPVGDDEGGTVLDLLASDEGTTEDVVAEARERSWLAKRMREFGSTLTGKDKAIFENRLLTEDPQTLQEIGALFDISRERVRQIEERLKKRLKAFLMNEMKDVKEVEIVPARPKGRRRKNRGTAPR